MGRKRRSPGELSPTIRKRLAVIEACERSGEKLSAYAERKGLSAASLYQVKKLARQKGLLAPHRRSETGTPAEGRAGLSRPRFTEAIRSSTRSEGPSPAWRFRFASGEVLEGHMALDTDEALQWIEALRGSS